MGLGQILAVRALPLEEIRHCIGAKAVESHIEPVGHCPQHRALDAGIVEVQVWLVRKEAVPEELTGLLVPGPVGALRIREDDPSVLVFIWGIAPYVIVTVGRVWI